MNVLSLFDGIGCGRIALERAGIKVDKYYASEIDKNAIKVAKYNYPDIIEIGDIRNINCKDLPNIDLIIGGSPCTNFSSSGKRNGMITKDKLILDSLDKYLELKEENCEFDGYSYLFWEYVRILKEVRNSVNRKVNCETANINKTVSAAVKQIEDIEYIKKHMGLDGLSPALSQVAQVRLQYPEAPLKELGEMLNPPVGKSGVNHRLRKLSEIADQLRG